MKMLKHASIVAMIAALMGCGHGFEGEYQRTTSTPLLDALGVQTGTLVIGDDYIESEGKRTEFEEIFVRESGSEKYLVLKDKNAEEEAWKIVDEKTLIQKNGLINVTLKRTK